jgi:TorA maturation chaperone TorD
MMHYNSQPMMCKITVRSYYHNKKCKESQDTKNYAHLEPRDLVMHSYTMTLTKDDNMFFTPNEDYSFIFFGKEELTAPQYESAYLFISEAGITSLCRAVRRTLQSRARNENEERASNSRHVLTETPVT